MNVPNQTGLAPAAQENLEAVLDFYEREAARVSWLQTAIEGISRFFGSPAYFAGAVIFIVAWVLVNSWGVHAGWTHVDEPPFFWLQGIVSSNALLLTVAVLIRQNRMAQLAEHRAHLDLQVNLLTERKVSKVLSMLDGLATTERPEQAGEACDDEARELSEPADPQALLEAIRRTGQQR